MTISTSTSRVAYTATASQTVFAVPFVFWDDTDLLVYVEGTLKTLTTHYTVAGGDGSTGTVTFLTGQTLSDSVVIEREVPATRTTDFPLSGNFAIGTLNTQLDKLFALMQQQNTDLTRAIIEDPAYGGLDLMLPAPADRANKYLAFDDDGNVTVAESPADATAGYKFKVSGNDTTAGYLNGKLVAGGLLTLTEGSDGSDETLTAAVSAASQGEIQTGTEAGKALTPANFREVRATNSEALAGTEDRHWVSPAKLAASTLMQGWHMFPLPATVWDARTTNGPGSTYTESATHKVNMFSLDFDQSTQEFIQIRLPLPPSYDGGPLRYEADFGTPSTTGNFACGLQAMFLRHDDPIDTAFGSAVELTTAVTAGGDFCQTARSGDITPGGTYAATATLVLQFYRKVSGVSSNVAADVRVFGVRLYLGIDDPVDI